MVARTIDLTGNQHQQVIQFLRTDGGKAPEQAFTDLLTEHGL